MSKDSPFSPFPPVAVVPRETMRKPLGAEDTPPDPPPSARIPRAPAPPSPPPSDPPAQAASRFGKYWGFAVGAFTSFLLVLDMGTRIAARNDSYATVGALNEVSARLAALSERIGELKVADVGPRLSSHSDAIAELRLRTADLERRAGTIERGIEGFNRAQSRQGRPSPIPLQAQ